ncbi:aromatic acid exporter family protein, partial [Mycobacterium intracellulare]|nr:aromatic acid exporter family protein [Mycobacterium intracellulare]
TALADRDAAGACAYTASARHHASQLPSGAGAKTQAILADAVGACIDDLQRVIDLRPV